MHAIFKRFKRYTLIHIRVYVCTYVCICMYNIGVVAESEYLVHEITLTFDTIPSFGVLKTTLNFSNLLEIQKLEKKKRKEIQKL